jgi:hypothetical protein
MEMSFKNHSNNIIKDEIIDISDLLGKSQWIKLVDVLNKVEANYG